MAYDVGESVVQSGAPDFETASSLIERLELTPKGLVSQVDLLGAIALGTLNNVIADRVGYAESTLKRRIGGLGTVLQVDSATTKLRSGIMDIAWSGRLLEWAFADEDDVFPVTSHFMSEEGLQGEEVKTMDTLHLRTDDLRLLQLIASRVHSRDIAVYFRISEAAVKSRRLTLWSHLGKDRKAEILGTVGGLGINPLFSTHIQSFDSLDGDELELDQECW